MTDTDPEGVLTPDELTLDNDRLQELADGRFVISVDEPAAEPAAVPTTTDGDTDTSSPDTNTTAQIPAPATLDGAFAVVVAADLAGAHFRVPEASNDVGATFEALVTWYAEAVAPDVPTNEAVAVLINNADLGVKALPQ